MEVLINVTPLQGEPVILLSCVSKVDQNFSHLPLVLHIYSLVNQVSIDSDDGLSPIRHQAIIWTSAGLLSIGPLGTNFSEIWTKIQNFQSQECISIYRLWKKEAA